MLYDVLGKHKHFSLGTQEDARKVEARVAEIEDAVQNVRSDIEQQFGELGEKKAGLQASMKLVEELKKKLSEMESTRELELKAMAEEAVKRYKIGKDAIASKYKFAYEMLLRRFRVCQHRIRRDFPQASKSVKLSEVEATDMEEQALDLSASTDSAWE